MQNPSTFFGGILMSNSRLSSIDMYKTNHGGDVVKNKDGNMDVLPPETLQKIREVLAEGIARSIVTATAKEFDTAAAR